MFYYPVVLRRGTGCFSTIWLAATRGVNVTRRELLQVNVPRSCDDIMSYILVQVPPPQPGMPQPRFSLYLSSQLQYGVVVVYHRQCGMFLKELQSLVGKLLKYRAKKLDMADLSRKKMLCTDPLSLLDEIDGPLDPLFGEMDQFIPSPSTLIQMEQTPERRSSSTELESHPERSASPMSRHTVSPESITIKEPAAIVFPEFLGPDLDDDVNVTIEALQAQIGHFLTGEPPFPMTPEGRAKVNFSSMRPFPTAEDAAEVERARKTTLGGEATETALTADPTTASDRDLILPTRDGSSGMPQPLADQMTPVAPPPPSSSPPMAAVPAPDMKDAPRPEETQPKKKRKRGRQLIFLDPQTQIPYEELEQQIKDDLFATRVQQLLSVESRGLKTAEALLSQPCGFLPEELDSLWTQNATVTPLDSIELWPVGEGAATSSSEEGRAIGPDGSSVEVPREGTEPEAPEMSGSGSLPLEVSNRQESPKRISPICPLEQESVLQDGAALEGIPELPEDRARPQDCQQHFPEAP
ncbi:meiotic recombination protein REC8 homolog isoform X2 [Hippocampus zosterae]|uniref:meiotic recombination protein REC8 homolog isoform X2 n=1 Tax=Hippocampus zosterae TaxID=109293 RepID=UPI00223E0150|nr:meiotic recombination protein REC8 homolog isoform X2 [Hippocampus zosterae]